MWFDSVDALLRIVLVGAAAYATLVLALRFTGKRTLAKLNAFDFAVTVALGSTLATILLSQDVAWAEGATAFAVLLLLQMLVSWASAHLPKGRSVVTARPTLVLVDGVPDHEAMGGQRLTLTEITQAVRSSGVGGLDQVSAVVLESDGTLSVITRQKCGDGSALDDVPGWTERR